MQVLKVQCKECREWLSFQLLEGTDEISPKEATIDAIKALEGPWSCGPGHHVELSPARNWLIFETAKLEEIPDYAGDQEKWLEKMKETYSEVISSDEMHKKKIITSFAYGEPMTNDGNAWSFSNAPNGHRYYYRMSDSL